MGLNLPVVMLLAEFGDVPTHSERTRCPQYSVSGAKNLMPNTAVL